MAIVGRNTTREKAAGLQWSDGCVVMRQGASTKHNRRRAQRRPTAVVVTILVADGGDKMLNQVCTRVPSQLTHFIRPLRMSLLLVLATSDDDGADVAKDVLWRRKARPALLRSRVVFKLPPKLE